MKTFLELAITLVIILLAAKLGGYLSLRLGQPSVLGELLFGVILGPSIVNVYNLPFITDAHIPETIHLFAEIGVLLLMFIAGLDLHLSDLAKSGKISALAGTLGMLFPLFLGTGLGLIFNMVLEEAIFLGLILSATSVSISAQVLMELQVLRSRVGVSLLGTAVFDDILVVLGLSIFSAVILSDAGGGVIIILGVLFKMVLYIAVGLIFGLLLIPKLSRQVHILPISQGLLTFTIVMILLYGWAAEELGQMAAITGAFLAGLMFARSPLKERIQSGIFSLAYGFFVPIFFIDVGLKANFRTVSEELILLFIALTFIAIIGKILGAGLGSLWSGLNKLEALQLGIGTVSRGEVGLIVASVGISAGVIPTGIYSVIVGVVILTTLLTPPLLRLSFRSSHPKGEVEEKFK